MLLCPRVLTRRAVLSRVLSTKAYEVYSPCFRSDIYAKGPQEWKQLAGPEAVSTTTVNGVEYLHVTGDAMRQLSKQAFSDVAHLLRPAHLQQLRNILDDKDGSPTTNS
jgi:fumarate hydratase class I